MSERNAPCPCGSGKKYKRCCLLLSQELKKQPRYKVDYKNLHEVINEHSHVAFDVLLETLESESLPLSACAQDFECCILMMVHAWNISRMSKGFRHGLLSFIKNENIRSVIHTGSNIYAERSQLKDMIVGFEITGFKDDAFQFSLETKALDKKWISDRKQTAIDDVNDSLDALVQKTMRTANSDCS